MIDYARARREGPGVKRALTLAERQPAGDERREAVVSAVLYALRRWDGWGAWPDDWSRWNRALADAFPWHAGIDIDTLDGWRKQADHDGPDGPSAADFLAAVGAFE